MSEKVVRYVWETSNATGTELVCLLALADYANDEGESAPTVQELARRCRVGERSIQKVLADLKEMEEIKATRGLLPIMAMGWISKKKPQSLQEYAFATTGRYPRQCEWCKGSTFILHEHHYPTPKCEGGTATVNICPNCHTEYHFLTSDRYEIRMEED